jgi:hypothetical protein
VNEIGAGGTGGQGGTGGSGGSGGGGGGGPSAGFVYDASAVLTETGTTWISDRPALRAGARHARLTRRGHPKHRSELPSGGASNSVSVGFPGRDIPPP